MFGDTKHKGGGSLPIWVRYDHIGIEFGFQGNNWADTANPIVCIKVFPKALEGQTECSLCLKSLKNIDEQKIAKCPGCDLSFCQN